MEHSDTERNDKVANTILLENISNHNFGFNFLINVILGKLKEKLPKPMMKDGYILRPKVFRECWSWLIVLEATQGHFWGFFEGGRACCLRLMGTVGVGALVGWEGGVLSAPDGSQAPLRRIFIPRHHPAKQ